MEGHAARSVVALFVSLLAACSRPARRRACRCTTAVP